MIDFENNENLITIAADILTKTLKDMQNKPFYTKDITLRDSLTINSPILEKAQFHITKYYETHDKYDTVSANLSKNLNALENFILIDELKFGKTHKPQHIKLTEQALLYILRHYFIYLKAIGAHYPTLSEVKTTLFKPSDFQVAYIEEIAKENKYINNDSYQEALHYYLTLLEDLF